MGIYVKDMEMPKSCFECDLYNDESNFCKAQKEYLPFALFGRDYKGANCPLVEVSEPHGRLIDTDYLREHLYICETNGRPLHIMELDERLACIDEIPTVIEAEGE